MIDFYKLIEKFWEYIENEQIEIYNEFSLQHELGIFLRNNLTNYKVQFERNVSFFNIPKKNTIKHEIDIVIYKSDMSKKYAIELKYPRNGQVPEEMYFFVQDIVFMEQLLHAGFTATFVLTLVDNKDFYKGKVNQKSIIYDYFRVELKDGTSITPKCICGGINKPTKAKGIPNVTVTNDYFIKWNDNKIGKYYFMKIK